MPRVHSRYAVDAARLLGARIRLGRRERRWTQEELASRIGSTSRTVSKIEHGDLGVALGTALEAAALVGVSLFEADRTRLGAELDRTVMRSALLGRPRRADSHDDVHDDF